ncbi:hypothetical protein NPIL_311151 [Nephila pilipes]|uniref:Uncharacterized protein n=1 Tax=Nephila pilipes TaxID=299642 RepID=A0A8X6TPC4_NEPPI|nr:hypothetical protein NPIL_311151 [Nephila pilipes]
MDCERENRLGRGVRETGISPPLLRIERDGREVALDAGHGEPALRHLKGRMRKEVKREREETDLPRGEKTF